MERKDITLEEYERIKSHINDFSFTDLVIWRNEIANSDIGINNRLYELIDSEIKERRIGKEEEKKVGRNR